MEMNFGRNQNHGNISQQVHHNRGHAYDSSQVSADTKLFLPLDWRLNISLKWNANQENLPPRNTIKQDVKQQYSQNTIVKIK